MPRIQNTNCVFLKDHQSPVSNPSTSCIHWAEHSNDKPRTILYKNWSAYREHSQNTVSVQRSLQSSPPNRKMITSSLPGKKMTGFDFFFFFFCLWVCSSFHMNGSIIQIKHSHLMSLYLSTKCLCWLVGLSAQYKHWPRFLFTLCI